MTTRTLFIFHKDCFDGFTAAWIYSRFVDGDAEFFPARYGDAPPLTVVGRPVVIADFSYPRQQMEAIARTAARLVVLDHHATAREALDGFEDAMRAEGRDVTVVFDMERSGTGIVWDYYFSSRVRPAFVNYVEDRDLWRLVLPHTREYNANVYAAPMTFEAWDALCSRSMNEMVSRGQAILDYMHQYGTKALAEARLVVLGGLGPVWAVNLPYMNCSDNLSRLMEERGVDFVAGYFCRGDGRWQFSLRSRNDFDCSVIAKMFGGGGHPYASGFDVAGLAEVFGR